MIDFTTVSPDERLRIIGEIEATTEYSIGKRLPPRPQRGAVGDDFDSETTIDPSILPQLARTLHVSEQDFRTWPRHRLLELHQRVCATVSS